MKLNAVFLLRCTLLHYSALVVGIRSVGEWVARRVPVLDRLRCVRGGGCDETESEYPRYEFPIRFNYLTCQCPLLCTCPFSLFYQVSYYTKDCVINCKGKFRVFIFQVYPFTDFVGG